MPGAEKDAGKSFKFPQWTAIGPREFLFLALALAYTPFASPAFAEEDVITILPGDPRILEDTTKPHISRWAMTRLMPGKEIEQRGAWLDKHEIVEIDGRILHKFQSDVILAEGRPRREIFYWDQSTMETVTAEFENYNYKGGWGYFIYDKSRVSQVYRKEPFDDMLSTVVELEYRVFEIGHGLVFAHLLNLQPGGKKLRFPYHQRTTDTAEWITFEATKYEQLETPRYGTVKTLLIETSAGWKYWTVPEPPYVYRLDIPFAGDGTDRWELMDYVVTEQGAAK